MKSLIPKHVRAPSEHCCHALSVKICMAKWFLESHEKLLIVVVLELQACSLMLSGDSDDFDDAELYVQIVGLHDWRPCLRG